MSDVDLQRLGEQVSAARQEVEARGETFYPGASRIHLAAFPPKERWDDWVELDSRAWPERVGKRSMLVPTTCFNCESACGLLAYVDKETLQVRKFEGNPEHPGSRGRNCAKGPATINQVTDPDRVLHPLRRVGERGGGGWERVSWDEALDDIAGRIRAALQEGRAEEIMYHVGRPGEDGFTERVLASWGVDGHNSHTNVCSSGARTGYAFWMGIDRPSPDHANADVIFLISAHLEAGHYFNPHAQRVMEAKQRGAKLIVVDTRLSNTATHADWWLAPWPGSEAAMNLAIAQHIIATRRYNREFVRRWWNWEEYLAAEHPDVEPTFEAFEEILAGIYAEYTFEFAQAETGIPAATLAEVAEAVAGAGTRLSTHNWRSAAAGNLGGWQVSRTLFLLNALMGAIATPGGTFPNAWNKFVPRPFHWPAHRHGWNELTWPLEYPLANNELSFLLPHFLKEGRGYIDTYFTRVYNPVWTNPDGFSWIEALSDESKVGLHVALTPTWSETAYFADYVLPMGHASERHDLHSYETHDGQWVGFRQPVLREARRRLGQPVSDTRDANPGEVWEENEFWIELSWRIDPDARMEIRQFHESAEHPGTRLSVDEYYGWIFEHSIPGLPEKAAAENLTPLDYMRRYGAFEITDHVGARHEEEVPGHRLVNAVEGDLGLMYCPTSAVPPANAVPLPTVEPDPDGRRRIGVRVDDKVLRGFPTPSGRLEFWSSTLAAWGWREHALPGYIRSHVAPAVLEDGQMPLISTFRLPVQIHTRSANSKWLDEIAHTNPLWLHPTDAARFEVGTGDLVRVETEIGHFVLKAWVTEGIRPGVVACSHHMGRWKPENQSAGVQAMMATVALDRSESGWSMTRKSGIQPYESSDPDTRRLWWTEGGVHQNLTFAVHPDPISGQHCWHQAVRVRKAEPGEEAGDIAVDTDAAHDVYHRWLELTRRADLVSPDGTRRPHWLLRPLKPGREHYKLAGVAADAPVAAVSPSVSPEVFRALAVVCEGPQAGPVAAALGAVPDTAEHTDLFSFQLPPYASIFLGADGMLGGEPAGRVAGFWRALHLDPPAEPDHLAALLGLYAALTEAEEGETDPARRRLRGEARRALLAEHLAPWVCVYATGATRVAGAGYRPWAEALSAAVLAEAAAAELAGTARTLGTGTLALHLREAPPPAEPGDDGLDAYLGRLLAPVASGIVVTRRDLVEAARRLGLGLRMGERRFVLSALITQDPAAVAGWLAEEAGAWGEEHDRLVPVLGDTARFWRERARQTEAHLRHLLSTDFRAA